MQMRFYEVQYTKGEDGMILVSCPAFGVGCFSQGRTLDEARQGIHEAIQLVLLDGELPKSEILPVSVEG